MRRLAIALCAALAGAAFAVPAQAQPAYGVQGFAGPTRAGAVPDFELAQRLGVHITRIEASWAALEPNGPGGAPDPAALAALDSTVAAAARRRIKVVLFVNRTPCWASSAPAAVREDCSGPQANRADVWRYSPANPADAVPIHTFLAARYGAKLAAMEVWNEPDQANELYWAGPDKVAKYVALVKALYGPLKRVTPRLPVLAGSFVGTDGRWLAAMYARGVKGYYDALAVHFYALPLYGLTQTRATQRRFGDRTPMWLTEFGWNSCARPGGPAAEFGHLCVTPAGQAKNLADTAGGLRKMPWVKAAIQFNLVDQSNGFRFGLLDANRRAKPVLATATGLLRGARLPTTRPTVRLTRRGSQIRAQGTASGADVLSLRVFQGSTLRLRATLRTDPLRHWSILLPAQLGTRGLRVVVRHSVLHTSATARN